MVFKQGDFGDQMYIILQGSVNVKIDHKLGSYTELKLVNVLYDGQHFGELAIMKTSSN